MLLWLIGNQCEDLIYFTIVLARLVLDFLLGCLHEGAVLKEGAGNSLVGYERQ